ncbi:MAG: PEGA domain-containing protein [Methanoregulaceae archaeon]
MTPRIFIASSLLLLVLFAGGAAAAGTDSAVSWKTTLDSSTISTLSMTSDGSYIAAAGTDGTVYLLNNQGGKLWSYIATDLDGKSRNPSVAIQPLGTSVFVGAGTKIYSFDRGGTRQWFNDTGVNVYGVAISTNGYGFSTAKNTLRFFTTSDSNSASSNNANPIILQEGDAHTRINTTQVDNITYTSTETYYITKKATDIFSINTAAPMWKVAMSRDGGFVGAGTIQDHRAYLYERSGDQRWSFDTGSPVSDVEIAYNGTFLATGAGTSAYLLDKEGTLLWKYAAAGTVNGVSINRDGTVIGVGMQDGSVVILNQNGETIWSGKLDNNVQDIASDSSGVQFAVASGGAVYLLTPTFTTPVTVQPTAPVPVTATPGEVVITSDPAGADVYVDNIYRGITPVTLSDLTLGSHTILLKMEGRQDWSSSIDVSSGSALVLKGVLSTVATTVSPTQAGLPGTGIFGAIIGLLAIVWARKKS